MIVDEYEAFEPAPGAHENGRLVQGEAVADLGGLTIAYKAFERTPQAKAHKVIDGYTPEQRFFLAYAQVWRSIATEGYIRQIAATNKHPGTNTTCSARCRTCRSSKLRSSARRPTRWCARTAARFW